MQQSWDVQKRSTVLLTRDLRAGLDHAEFSFHELLGFSQQRASLVFRFHVLFARMLRRKHFGRSCPFDADLTIRLPSWGPSPEFPGDHKLEAKCTVVASYAADLKLCKDSAVLRCLPAGLGCCSFGQAVRCLSIVYNTCFLSN